MLINHFRYSERKVQERAKHAESRIENKFRSTFEVH